MDPTRLEQQIIKFAVLYSGHTHVNTSDIGDFMEDPVLVVAHNILAVIALLNGPSLEEVCVHVVQI